MTQLPGEGRRALPLSTSYEHALRFCGRRDPHAPHWWNWFDSTDQTYRRCFCHGYY